MLTSNQKFLLENKTQILGSTARFEVTTPSIFQKHLGSSHIIYPAKGERGECISLFKVLQTNLCQNNCFYCSNRKDRECTRSEFRAEELAKIFMSYYKKRWVNGLFLSSGIWPDANSAQEKMLQTILILRKKYGYGGYLHCKILPGVDRELILQCGKLSTRLSINLEAPSQNHLSRLSPYKDFQKDLLNGLKNIISISHKYPLRGGVTSQVVVGGSEESDKEILILSKILYKDFALRRVYYSAFTPIPDTPLESRRPCLPLREFRLYQADFLLKKYGFHTDELPFDKQGNLPLDKDPKIGWALTHLERFPIEVNKASKEDLLRVPGIGIKSASRIMNVRKGGRITDIHDLRKLGVVVTRAAQFVTLNGRYSPLKVKMEEPYHKQLLFWEESDD